MTEYTQTAHEICEELNVTPTGTERAAEAVAAREDRLNNWSGNRTSLALPTGDRVHKHQLVVDIDTGDHFMVKTLDADRIKLVQVYPPESDGHVGFGSSYWLTIGDFLRGADPQYSQDGEPVWAY